MRYWLGIAVLALSLYGGGQRIVALSPAIDEILFALGKGEEVVGNTLYATYPEAAKNVPKVGGYFSVSLEKIVALDPTLVLMQRNNLALRPKLEKLGIQTALIRIDSLADLKAGIVRIGTLTDAKARAEEIVSQIDAHLAKTKGILRDKKILIVFGVNFDLDKEIYISGNHLYYADIIRASGNRNAYTDKSIDQPTVSMEGIIGMNPDIVYILAHRIRPDQTDALIAPWLRLPITAARAKTIYVTTRKYAGMPSQRVIHFIDDYRKVLHDAARKLAALSDR